MGLFTARHHILVEENYVTKVIAIVNKYHAQWTDLYLSVGWSGCAEQPFRWFVDFTTTNVRWKSMLKEFERIPTLIIDKQ